MDMNWHLLNKLEKEHGDSFYIIDFNKFEKNYDDFLAAFSKYYPKVNIGYSYKTNYIPNLCAIVDQKGGYAEVVSEMEYDLAVSVGVAPSRIIVNGPYKTHDNLIKFLLSGATVNIDSLEEAQSIFEIAKSNADKQISVGVRCNFDLSDGSTSRFGVDVTTQEFKHLVKKIFDQPNLVFRGLHCHYPNRDIESYQVRVDNIISLSKDVFKGLTPEYIDIGGGYFGNMHESLKAQFSCQVPSYNDYAEVIARKFAEAFGPENAPELILEPGSALVADTMKFVAKINEIKWVRGKPIAMTSGSKFNTGLISSTVNLPISIIQKDVGEASFYSSIDLSGYTCIESDYLYRGYKGALAKEDYAVLENLGSYSVVFKPPFILPNVPVLALLESKEDFFVVKRKETLKDIFQGYSYLNS